MAEKLVFSTKGRTLEDLSLRIKSARVLPLMRFPVSLYESNAHSVISGIRKKFREDFLIIRSSAQGEDSHVSSNAGHFHSVLNVPRKSNGKIAEAINSVIDSYESGNGDNEVLVQPMLSNIKVSGVAFTADIDTLAPYYVVNYDESGLSNTVTGGASAGSKTVVHFKHSPFPCTEPLLRKLIVTCRELEKLFKNPFLDIEFAVDKDGQLYIFQCRPIVTGNKENLSDLDLTAPLAKVYEKIEKLSAAHPNLLGDRAFWGVMTDWNPAEMIGLKPKPLALSLYKELITDNVWAYQRDNYGYRNLRSHPLMISLLGVPYIDVRVDFNSFIPKNLNDGIAAKLVEFYLNELDSKPTNHDKVEFEIVHSCYYLNLPQKLNRLLDHGFNDNEIRRIEYALLEITNGIIDPDKGLYKSDLKKIEILKERFERIINSGISEIEKIYWLVEDCKRYGTLPFAGVARAAFIAVQFLKSFVELGIMNQQECDRFMNSLNTVAKRLNADLHRLSNKTISRRKFLSLYGHLRPGTYDILSPRYDESFENYFSSAPDEICTPASYCFSKKQLKKIGASLIENGIKTDPEGLLLFIREAIEGREYAKFVFTKSLSKILCLLENLGASCGISREEMAFLDIRVIQSLYAVLDHRDTGLVLRDNIRQNTESYNYTKAVKLPALIRKPGDVYSFIISSDEPNFITLLKTEAPVITEDQFRNGNIENKIAFIKSADPGYDFLFTKKISGLVTQFGGSNSHMTIRCAELGIPAVIGAGEKNFAEWSRAKVLEIDCANRQVRVIS